MWMVPNPVITPCVNPVAPVLGGPPAAGPVAWPLPPQPPAATASAATTSAGAMNPKLRVHSERWAMVRLLGGRAVDRTRQHAGPLSAEDIRPPGQEVAAGAGRYTPRAATP